MRQPQKVRAKRWTVTDTIDRKERAQVDVYASHFGHVMVYVRGFDEGDATTERAEALLSILRRAVSYAKAERRRVNATRKKGNKIR